MSDSSPDPQTSGLPSAAGSASALPDRAAAFHSALLTEHFVLESARGITVSESSSRASLYLMTLSSGLVAFGFLAATPFAPGFLAIVLPVVVILGIFTYVRLVQTSLEDVAALGSIQRIRRYYATLLPGAEEFFPIPAGAVPNEMLDIGQRGYKRGVFFTISSAIGIVNSFVAGAGGTLLFFALVPSLAGALGFGAVIAAGLILAHGIYQEKRYARFRRRADPHAASEPASGDPR